MKKIVTAVLSLIIVSISAHAQTAPSGAQQNIKREAIRHHHHRRMRRHHRHSMAEQLNFSTEQKLQAKTYHREFRKKMQALNSNENITVKAQRDQKVALLKEQKSKMQSLLTPEQKDKMAQLKAARKTKAEEHYAARMDKIKAKLNLTDEQVTQMKSQREEMFTKLKAIKEDDNMDRVTKKEKLMALKTQMKEDRKKIFTADQLKQIEDMKKARMEKREVK